MIKRRSDEEFVWEATNKRVGIRPNSYYNRTLSDQQAKRENIGSTLSYYMNKSILDTINKKVDDETYEMKTHMLNDNGKVVEMYFYRLGNNMMKPTWR